MGKAVRRGAEDGVRGGRAVGRTSALGSRLSAWAGARSSTVAVWWALLLAVLLVPAGDATAQAREQLRQGRFTVVHTPRDRQLAQSLLAAATSRDTFPGLARPAQQVELVIATDRGDFRRLIGPHAPEWGAAIAIPAERRIVMQGRRAGSDAGDPLEVLRHELAHLALHEALGDLPPRWFDEGYASYAAGEWSREEVLATNLALAVRGPPTFDRLEATFSGGSGSAQQGYALAYRAVAELASLDPDRGLSGFFAAWKQSGSLDAAVRASYGITLDGFEALWQKRTRRRYGMVALAADLSVATLITLMLVLPLYLARKRRDRRRMAALIEADRLAAVADRDSTLALLLGDGWDEPPRAEAESDETKRRLTDS